MNILPRVLSVQQVLHLFFSAPGEVPAPRAVAGATYLYLTWDSPEAPNGIITGYFLYQDGNLIYTGGQREFNVTQDLQVGIYHADNLNVDP